MYFWKATTGEGEGDGVENWVGGWGWGILNVVTTPPMEDPPGNTGEACLLGSRCKSLGCESRIWGEREGGYIF